MFYIPVGFLNLSRKDKERILKEGVFWGIKVYNYRKGAEAQSILCVIASLR
jgi:hypothetical protein